MTPAEGIVRCHSIGKLAHSLHLELPRSILKPGEGSSLLHFFLLSTRSFLPNQMARICRQKKSWQTNDMSLFFTSGFFISIRVILETEGPSRVKYASESRSDMEWRGTKIQILSK